MKNFKNGEEMIKTTYELVFDDGAYNGFCFPCDKDGNIDIEPDNDAALDNYKWCLEHKDQFVRAGEVIATIRTWRENNSGECTCGKRIELFNEYMGACECPYCGQWWNIWGQELNNPSTWSQGEDW